MVILSHSDKQIISLSKDNGIVIIRQSKGKKDRIAPLFPKILEMVREYDFGYKPKTWLFEGQNEHTK